MIGKKDGAKKRRTKTNPTSGGVGRLKGKKRGPLVINNVQRRRLELGDGPQEREKGPVLKRSPKNKSVGKVKAIESSSGTVKGKF